MLLHDHSERPMNAPLCTSGQRGLVASGVFARHGSWSRDLGSAIAHIGPKTGSASTPSYRLA